VQVLAAFEANGLGPQRLMRSPLVGPKGNIEFLVWAGSGQAGVPTDALLAQVEAPPPGGGP
jgi:hypothetical protein